MKLNNKRRNIPQHRFSFLITTCFIYSIFTCSNALSCDSELSVQSYNDPQLRPYQNLVEEKIQKLFINNRLPQNATENYEAKSAAVKAYLLLDEKKVLEALPYIFRAEEYFVSGSVHILIDIINHKYPEIPADISQAIHDQFINVFQMRNSSTPNNGIKSLDELFEVYKQKFAENERNLSKKNARGSSLKKFYTKLTSLVDFTPNYAPISTYKKSN